MGAGDADLKHRFQWNFPIFVSPNDPKKIYAASQYLIETTDEGASWKVISPDLTRNDKSKMGPSGGPITKDNTSVEYYGTIFYAAESPVEAGVLWVGSDDGLVHVSRDGGAHWTNVTPPKTIMPEWIMINQIEASPTEKGAAYVAATMYKWDDFHPYIYKTKDYGATWTKIVDGIAADHFTRVVRADPKKAGLLFAGTERMVYVSFDDGGHWQLFQYKLPIVPVHDLAIKDDALIAATHGRAFWMIDDLNPVRQLAADTGSKPVQLFAPSPAWRIEGGRGGGIGGTNPPNGVTLDFLLRDQKPGTKVSLAFLGPDNKVIRELKGTVEAEAPKPVELKSGAPAPPPSAVTEAVKSEGSPSEQNPESDEEERGGRRGGDDDKLKGITNGHNRVTWNLRVPEAEKFPGMILWAGGTIGPRVPPGTYTARLTVGDQSASVPFEVRADKRSSSTAADLKAQYDFVMSVHSKLSEVNGQIKRIRDVRKQIVDLKKHAAKPVIDAATELDKKMTAIEETLYQTKNKSSQDPLNYPIRLNDKLSGVGDSASTGAYPPTAQQLAVRDELVVKIDAELAKLKAIWDTDLPALNKMVKESSEPAIK
jgi:hypothetical protein